MSEKEPHQRLQQLIEHFDRAMLVTHAPDGALRGRPMLIAGTEAEGALWFITQADSGKVEEILRDDRALVLMQDRQRQLSISGRAEVVPDQQRLIDLWDPRHDPWFEQGPRDPSAVLIGFHGERAEFWDRSGIKGLRLALDLITASPSGKALPLKDRDPERRSKVQLERS